MPNKYVLAMNEWVMQICRVITKGKVLKKGKRWCPQMSWKVNIIQNAYEKCPVYILPRTAQSGDSIKGSGDLSYKEAIPVVLSVRIVCENMPSSSSFRKPIRNTWWACSNRAQPSGFLSRGLVSGMYICISRKCLREHAGAGTIQYKPLVLGPIVGSAVTACKA